MAYSRLPARTTADANSAADVNQLQLNIDAVIDTSSTAAPVDSIVSLRSAVNDIIDTTSTAAAVDTLVSLRTSIDAISTAPAAAGGPFEVGMPAGSFDLPGVNYAPLFSDTTSTTSIQSHIFDDSTEEFIEAQFTLPNTISTSGTATIELYGYAITAASSKNVEYRLYHAQAGNGDLWKNTDHQITSFATAADRLVSSAHGLSNGNYGFLSTDGADASNLPTGLSNTNGYYVVDASTNTFSISTTSGGARADFTDDGGDTVYFTRDAGYLYSGDLSLSATQNAMNRHSVSFSMGDVGWQPNDQIKIKLGRVNPSANDLVGDYAITHLKVIVPRS